MEDYHWYLDYCSPSQSHWIFKIIIWASTNDTPLLCLLIRTELNFDLIVSSTFFLIWHHSFIHPLVLWVINVRLNRRNQQCIFVEPNLFLAIHFSAFRLIFLHQIKGPVVLRLMHCPESDEGCNLGKLYNEKISVLLWKCIYCSLRIQSIAGPRCDH